VNNFKTALTTLNEAKNIEDFIMNAGEGDYGTVHPSHNHKSLTAIYHAVGGDDKHPELKKMVADPEHAKTVIAAKKAEDKKAAPKAPKAPKADKGPSDTMTKGEYKKTVRDAAKGWKADNPGENLSQVAHDLAHAMLTDPRLHNHIKKHYGTTSKEHAAQIVADDLYN